VTWLNNGTIAQDSWGYAESIDVALWNGYGGNNAYETICTIDLMNGTGVSTNGVGPLLHNHTLKMTGCSWMLEELDSGGTWSIADGGNMTALSGIVLDPAGTVNVTAPSGTLWELNILMNGVQWASNSSKLLQGTGTGAVQSFDVKTTTVATGTGDVSLRGRGPDSGLPEQLLAIERPAA